MQLVNASTICGSSLTQGKQTLQLQVTTNTRHEAQNIKRIRGYNLFILLLLSAPSMLSNNRERRRRARRSEDARRLSAGVRRSFFVNNSNASPAEDVLGLVSLAGGRRAALPSTHGGSFTAPLTREALRAERRAAAERQQQRQENARGRRDDILRRRRQDVQRQRATGMRYVCTCVACHS